MYRVKVFGAGSIGNHLTHACRSLSWEVTVVDIDEMALERMRDEIYPTRYGDWDDAISLSRPKSVVDQPFDLVVIGTPPDSHIPIALAQLRNAAPRAILIEKPLCAPDNRGCEQLLELATAKKTFVAVGYNHTLTPHTVEAGELIRNGLLGEPQTISAAFREHWGGIFAAHPWLRGPADTYLGFTNRGGGASGEHSHALNIWQHFAHVCGLGPIVEVSATIDMIESDGAEYDRLFQAHVKTSSGLVGAIVQDVVTTPPQKRLRIQGTKGFLEWNVNHDGSQDTLRFGKNGGEAEERTYPKSRPDDFKPEINHLKTILDGAAVEESPITLNRGLDTMRVLAAAHESHRKKKWVQVDFDGPFPDLEAP